MRNEHPRFLFPACVILVLAVGCETTPKQARQQPPPGIEKRFAYDVVPLVNGDYDITVTGDHRASDAELRAAWKAKATDLAAGKGYIISDLAFKSQEHTHYQPMGVFMSFPMTSKNHSLFGTMMFR